MDERYRGTQGGAGRESKSLTRAGLSHGTVPWYKRRHQGPVCERSLPKVTQHVVGGAMSPGNSRGTGTPGGEKLKAAPGSPSRTGCPGLPSSEAEAQNTGPELNHPFWPRCPEGGLEGKPRTPLSSRVATRVSSTSYNQESSVPALGPGDCTQVPSLSSHTRFLLPGTPLPLSSQLIGPLLRSAWTACLWEAPPTAWWAGCLSVGAPGSPDGPRMWNAHPAELPGPLCYRPPTSLE